MTAGIVAHAETSALPSFGKLSVRVEQMNRTEVYDYTLRASSGKRQLEIVSGDTGPPTPPYNLVDLDTGRMTIVFPYNGTFMHLPADYGERINVRQRGAPVPGMPMPAPGYPGPIPGAPSSLPGPDSAFAQSFNIPTPQAPMTPVQAATDPLKLEPGEETREILGRTCRRYTLANGATTRMEIWAVSEVVPFYTYQRRDPSGPGRLELLESWCIPLRRAGLFPLLAIARQRETEVYRFEVTSITPGPLTEELVSPPAEFHETKPLILRIAPTHQSP